jgi:hypothetical protein
VKENHSEDLGLDGMKIKFYLEETEKGDVA